MGSVDDLQLGGRDVSHLDQSLRFVTVVISSFGGTNYIRLTRRGFENNGDWIVGTAFGRKLEPVVVGTETRIVFALVTTTDSTRQILRDGVGVVW